MQSTPSQQVLHSASCYAYAMLCTGVTCSSAALNLPHQMAHSSAAWCHNTIAGLVALHGTAVHASAIHKQLITSRPHTQQLTCSRQLQQEPLDGLSI